MIAFWKYDTYPYVLYGTVTDMKGDKVETKEYGKGHWFRPLVIYPDGDDANSAISRIRILTKDHIDRLEEAKKISEDKLFGLPSVLHWTNNKN